MAEKQAKLVRSIFNADLQRKTDHELSVDGNGEILAVCTENGRTLKFPVGMTVEEIVKQMNDLEEINAGQVKLQPQLDILAELAEKRDAKGNVIGKEVKDTSK